MYKAFLIFLFSASALLPQVVFEPEYSSVYNFLNRLALKEVVVLNDEIRPLSRLLIAEKLIEAECNLEELTSVERKELIYYKKDFEPEILILRESEKKETVIFNDNNDFGFRPFLYRDKNFTFTADPVLGFEYNNFHYDNERLRFNGLSFHGYYDNIGYSFYFRDNEISGNSIDLERKISPLPGIVRHSFDGENLQFSFVRGSVSYSWSWGSFDFSKEDIIWGSGRRGQLILSSKPPSFPFIRLILKPVDWLQFQYVHGWLESGVIDSNSFRYTLVNGRETYSHISKYIAAHIISLYPFKNFSFSLGESVIYSERLEPLYFIPVLFFRLADHYNSDTGDNAQIFFNSVYKFYPLKSKIYGTFFIDELSITNLFKGGNLSSLGYTVGINFIDPIIENSELIIEYTRTDPFLYMNSNDVQLYSSHGYQLGHWIGSNADQFFISLRKWIVRGLMINLWGEIVRKGQTELPKQQYELPYPPVLYGERFSMKTIGIEAEYEIFRKLFGKIYFNYSDISDEEEGRTPGFKTGAGNNFGFTIGYGF